MSTKSRSGRRAATRTAAAAVLMFTTLGVTAPALAERGKFKDPADATASLNDLRKVVVDHGTTGLRVKVRFTDLRRHSEAGPAGLGIFLDTRPDRKGPEFRLGTGLAQGTDYQLVRMRRWKPVGEPLGCDHALSLDYAADVLRFRAARPCIGTPERVRVGVKMIDMYDASHPVTDWLEGPRHWTRWLASG